LGLPRIDKCIGSIYEQLVDAGAAGNITNDNLNAVVDAQVYFKVKPDEESVKNSVYNVNNVNFQIVNLARTTLRNIIGTLTLKSANSERGRINDDLHKILIQETTNWGIDIVRAELKQIDPPKDVQETMNKDRQAEMKNLLLSILPPLQKQQQMKEACRHQRGRRNSAARILAAEGEAERRIVGLHEAAENILSAMRSCSRGLKRFRPLCRITRK